MITDNSWCWLTLVVVAVDLCQTSSMLTKERNRLNILAVWEFQVQLMAQDGDRKLKLKKKRLKKTGTEEIIWLSVKYQSECKKIIHTSNPFECLCFILSAEAFSVPMFLLSAPKLIFIAITYCCCSSFTPKLNGTKKPQRSLESDIRIIYCISPLLLSLGQTGKLTYLISGVIDIHFYLSISNLKTLCYLLIYIFFLVGMSYKLFQPFAVW